MEAQKKRNKNKLFPLFVMLFKSGANMSSAGGKPRISNPILRWLLYIVVVVFLFPAISSYIYLVYAMTATAVLYKQPSLMFSFAMVALSALTFFIGLSHAFSSFFASKDTEKLLSMPIPPQTIIIAKLLNILAWEYIASFFVLLPVIVIYPMHASVGPVYYIYSAVLFLISPVIPLCIGAVIAITVTRVFSLKISLEKIQAFMTFFALAASMALSIAMQRFNNVPDMSQSELMLQIFENSHFLASQVSNAYFPALLYSRAMAESGTLAGFYFFVSFALLSIGSFWATAIFSKQFYLKAVIRGVEGSQGKKSMFKASQIKTGSKAKAIFLMDLKTLVRTPVFFVNTATQFILAFFIPIGITAGGASLADLRGFFKNAQQFPSWTAPAASIVLCYFFTITVLTSTTFSREGKAIWLTRVFPATPLEQLIGRSISALAISAITSLAIFLAEWLWLMLPLGFSLAVSLLIALGSLPPVYFGLIADASHPKSDWDNPMGAVKQNLNLFFTMLFSAGYFAVMGLIIYILARLRISGAVILIELALIHIALVSLFVWLFLSHSQRWLTEG